MKVTKRILSIPPYIATTWDHVAALRLGEDRALIVQLTDGTQVRVPGLGDAALSLIFEAHMQNAEESDQTFAAMPFRMGPGGMEGMGTPLQHDPTQSEAPNLPQEVLSKISTISEMLDVQSAEGLPEAHQGCNCFHCQIARAISGSSEEVEEEEVSDEELVFKEWDIEPAGEQLYTVTNPLNTAEQYSVYLGKPVGCTCGDSQCEHIKAVLST